jgi:hypothetical protein
MKLLSIALVVWVGSTHGFTSSSTFRGSPMTFLQPVPSNTRTNTILAMNIENVKTKDNIRVGVIGTFVFGLALQSYVFLSYRNPALQ